MLKTSKNPNMVDGDELSLHRLSSPAADGVERKDNFRFSTLIPFRTTFEKILAVVAFVLFIICIIVIALLVMEKNSGPRNAGQTEGESPAIKPPSSAKNGQGGKLLSCDLDLDKDVLIFALKVETYSE